MTAFLYCNNLKFDIFEAMTFCACLACTTYQ